MYRFCTVTHKNVVAILDPCRGKVGGPWVQFMTIDQNSEFY